MPSVPQLLLRGEAEVRVGRRGARNERRLLTVEPVDHVAGGRAEHAEARAGPRREAAHREVGARAVVVQQREERLVGAHAARAQDRQLRRGQRRRAEQLQRLVDQVTAEVEHDPGALARGRRVLPALPELRRPALERRLEAMHLAERARSDDLADREEISVPAAILEDDERPLGGRRGSDELLGLGDGCREGLVDHERGARRERRQALLQMHVRGRAEHDEIEAAGEQFARRADDLGIRDDPARPAPGGPGRSSRSPRSRSADRPRGTARGRCAPRARSR